MELKQLLGILMKKPKTLVLSLILGLSLGLILFYLPKPYYAEGTLIVTRKIQPLFASDAFNYEGYYSQQVSMNYTNTVLALIESVDVKNMALQKLAMSTDDRTFSQFGKAVNAKKQGSQLVTVTVKSPTAEGAVKTWDAVVGSVLEVVSASNEYGDSNIVISKISSPPLVHQGFIFLWQYVVAGGLLGLIVSSLLISIKEYLWQK